MAPSLALALPHADLKRDLQLLAGHGGDGVVDQEGHPLLQPSRGEGGRHAHHQPPAVARQAHGVPQPRVVAWPGDLDLQPT